jgi:hypothetical protein
VQCHVSCFRPAFPCLKAQDLSLSRSVTTV